MKVNVTRGLFNTLVQVVQSKIPDFTMDYIDSSAGIKARIGDRIISSHEMNLMEAYYWLEGFITCLGVKND